MHLECTVPRFETSCSSPQDHRFPTRYNLRMKLAELARVLGADLHPPAPPPDNLHLAAVSIPAIPGEIEILGVAGIEDAQPHQLTFVANPKYAKLAHSTRAGAILVEPDFAPLSLPTLRLANPYLAFAQALEIFYQAPQYPPGIHPTAVLDASAEVGEGVHLGPYVTIGRNVRLGAYSVLLSHVAIYEGAQIGAHFFAHSHAVVREHCILGEHVTLQNGAIIGSDGFGFAKSSDTARGLWHKIPQAGPVVLEDWVEVQAHACIDRASVGETRIGAGAKIDNLVQVGHGSVVGANTLLCAQVGLAGSTRVGRNVILAGRSALPGTAPLAMTQSPPRNQESRTTSLPALSSAGTPQLAIASGCAPPPPSRGCQKHYESCGRRTTPTRSSIARDKLRHHKRLMTEDNDMHDQEEALHDQDLLDLLGVAEDPIRVLLLDDQVDNLLLRATILHKHGYLTETASTIEEAEALLHSIDVAVLDYHLGVGKFGTEVAEKLRELRPEVPIIILSATLERRFGGPEDMHLLKGYSSVDDLVAALRSFRSKRLGRPVMVDARDFFYSRINMAMGDDVVLEIMDGAGNWQYVNERCARLLDRPREWFPGKNMFEELPELAFDWQDIIERVAFTRETYIDRTYRGLLNLPRRGEEWVWNVLAFPITLHNHENGVVLTARTLERKPQL